MHPRRTDCKRFRRPSLRSSFPTLFLAAMLAVVPVRPAKAIEITLNFDTSEGNFPSYDPDGSKLAAISEAAATIWEQIHPGTDTFTWNVHWEEFDANTTTLAIANSFDGSIRVRSNLGGPVLDSNHWFFDPTPFQDEEFGNPFQELYRDAEPDQQAWFFNNAPDLLEIGFVRNGINAPASTGYDLLTFMLHEMGHLSGITFNDFAPDVPIPAHFIGNRAGVKVKRADDGHVGPENALMDPGAPKGVRIHPSALDIMVNANEKGWGEINLQRVDWMGDVNAPLNTTWQWPTGWAGGKVPIPEADVTLREGVVLSSFANVATGSLLITEESRLISSADLALARALRLKGAGSWGWVVLEMQNDSDLSVGEALEIDHATLELGGGNLSAATLTLLPGTVAGGGSNRSTLRGHGNVVVGNLSNKDLIKAEGGVLHLTANPGGKIDLSADETGAASVSATTGDLALHGDLADEFFGTMLIAGERLIEVNDTLVVGDGGGLQFSGTQGTARLVNASPAHYVDFQDDSWLEVAAGTSAEINATNILIQDAIVDISGGGGRLVCAGSLSLYGAGRINGEGKFLATEGMEVVGQSRLEVAGVDWDGKPGVPTTTTVKANSRLTLDVVDFDGTHDYVGTTILNNSAELAVNIATPVDAWALAPSGVIQMEKNAGLLGSLLHVKGQIQALGAGNSLDCPIILEPSGQLRIVPEGRLDLKGAIQWKGGYVGTDSGSMAASTLGQFAPADVRGSQHLLAGFFTWDGSDTTDSSTTIPTGAHLTIRALKIGTSATGERDGFGDTIALESSTLTMDLGGELLNYGTFLNEWTLNPTGVIQLDHDPLAPVPVVEGAALTNLGTLTGNGTLDCLVANRGLLKPGHTGATGRLSFGGELTHEGGGSFRFEIGGISPAPVIDQLSGGILELKGGTMEVGFINDFVPMAGQSFPLLAFSTINGTFSTVHLPTLPFGLKWDQSALYATGTIAVVADSGDTDGDGLPDDWELDHFDDLSQDGDDDPDKDGQSNMDEYLATTGPDDASSWLKVRMVSRIGTTATVGLTPFSPDRVYTLWRSTDLSPGSWGLVAAPTIQDLGAERQFTDTDATESEGFYQLHVNLPP